MELTGIECASGLDARGAAAVRELLEVRAATASRNRLLDSYYDGSHRPAEVGIDNVPARVDPGVRCDWARKAVTSVSERVRMDGFTFPGDARDEAMSRVLAANDLAGAFNRHVASELTHGCMFATVQRTGGHAAVRMHTAETAVATWDFAEGRVATGLVEADRRRYPWSARPVTSQVNLHEAGRVTVIRRTGPGAWAAEAMPTPMGRPMMEAFCFRPTGTRPFGETRISPAVRYLVDEVERTVRYMAVSAAFYATPQRYMLGLTDEQFDAMVSDKWRSYIGSMLLSTRDADGNVPVVGQFPAVSPQPYIEAVQMYAKMFSGATGVPLSSLGVVQDNPSSAQAIESQREDVCVAAEDCIEAASASMRAVALMAMAVEQDTGLDGLSEAQRAVMPHFRSPRTPSMAANADAAVKLAGVLDGFSQTREFLSAVGFGEAEVESIRAQIGADANRRALLAVMGAGDAREADG